eukprot:CAMPEP_0184302300 /NCGR_PEP_ID=MMETSP1049-20130417/12309_1 /TAXON_ID=77928 /ORGANISM="Proteomonas sulcata, Strain CCMP704" /LENGTH=70 /DNA_ID=CAMNT_0026613561 /DNA_START=696 /DNA_END=911 /DNA_ORIENTATION=-
MSVLPPLEAMMRRDQPDSSTAFTSPPAAIQLRTSSVLLFSAASSTTLSSADIPALPLSSPPTWNSGLMVS